MGGYRVQRDREQLLKDAHAAQDSGAFGIVLECIPSDIAAEVTAQLAIPTIGIGAGPDCDGQVLVVNDLLGLTGGYVPRFVKRYADLRGVIQDAATRYRDEVAGGEFPGPGQTYR
jgi:3-methyl-2-oxobutanoate hydroxymethyltransferase